MKEIYQGVKVYLDSDGKIIIEESNLEKNMNKVTEVDSDKIKDGSCKILETKKGRLAICKEKNKIKIYPIDED